MAFEKGYTPWNKGKKCPYLSKSTKARYAKGEKFGYYKGHPDFVPEASRKEQGKKNSKIMKGKHYSPKTEFKKGHTTNIGRLCPKEVREKISQANLGKVRTVEVRDKLSELRRRHPMSKSYYRRIGLKGVLKQQRMKGPTSIEKKVYDELKRRGILFEAQKLINGKFLVDAYIPSLNLVIEADGDYWHDLDRVKKRDKAKNAYLKKCGFGLLRLSEADINNDVKSCINKVEIN